MIIRFAKGILRNDVCCQSNERSIDFHDLPIGRGCKFIAEVVYFGFNYGLELGNLSCRKEGVQCLAPDTVKLMRRRREAVSGEPEAAGHVLVLVAPAGTDIQRVEVLWVINVDFSWRDTNDRACGKLGGTRTIYFYHGRTVFLVESLHMRCELPWVDDIVVELIPVGQSC